MPFDVVHSAFNKGFAYIEYEKPEEADQACKYMDGGQIDGQEVKVNISQPPAKPRLDRDRERERERARLMTSGLGCTVAQQRGEEEPEAWGAAGASASDARRAASSRA